MAEFSEVLFALSHEGILGRLLWPAILAMFTVYCFALGIRLLAGRKYPVHEIIWFVLLVIAYALWTAPAALKSFGVMERGDYLWSTVENVGMVFIPCLMVLLIQKQVSYKEVTVPVLLLWLAVPVVLSGWTVGRAVMIEDGTALSALPFAWQILFFLYVYVCIVRSYLLCFDVLYQMPRHMRRPAHKIIAALTVYLAANLALNIWPNLKFYNITAFAFGLAILIFYDELTTTSSANLIATSRDFVFSSQTTMVLVLSRTLRILDWNKKNGAQDLAYPRYLETFEHYRTRLLQEGNGRVSPHGDNIMLLNKDGAETQYLIKQSEISTGKRKYGYLVEISEISIVYGMLRLFEEIATMDQLTELFNRNAYLRTVKKLVDENVLPLCVIIGDVNNLKRINDRLGHLTGDRLLKIIAHLIRQCLPEGASAYRIGGDEFVLLMPGGGEEDALRFIAGVNQLCGAVHDEQCGTPSISWGYAIRSDGEQLYNDVFSEADQMMYTMKKQRFQFSSSGMMPRRKHRPEMWPSRKLTILPMNLTPTRKDVP